MSCHFCGATEDLVPGVNRKEYCMSCVRERGLFKCNYDGCNTYFIADDKPRLTGKGFLCEKHFSETYAICNDCHSVCSKRMAKKINSHKFLCQHCFDEKYFMCSNCGNVHPNSNKTVIKYKDSEMTICPECRRSYSECPHCGILIHKNETHKISYFDGTTRKSFVGCHNCLEEKFKRCPACNDFYTKDTEFMTIRDGASRYHNAPICERCFITTGIIHEYNYRPSFYVYFRDSESQKLLFGVENEIEVPRHEDETQTITLKNGEVIPIDLRKWLSVEIQKLIPKFIYQKNDGSLRNGIEIVSHPATFEFWNSSKDMLQRLFEFLKKYHCEGEGSSRAGMHVHVSRADMNLRHRNSMCSFVYGNREYIEKIARRASNSYSQFISMPASEASERQLEEIFANGNRYNAINWNNKNTVELRIFQSTLDYDHFMSNIEFCKALYDFTKERTTADCLSDRLTDDFKNWVQEKGFNHLYKTLQAIR